VAQVRAFLLEYFGDFTESIDSTHLYNYDRRDIHRMNAMDFTTRRVLYEKIIDGFNKYYNGKLILNTAGRPPLILYVKNDEPTTITRTVNMRQRLFLGKFLTSHGNMEDIDIYLENDRKKTMTAKLSLNRHSIPSAVVNRAISYNEYGGKSKRKKV